MNILAFETSSSAFSICLQKYDTIWQKVEFIPQQHANVILTYTSMLLTKAALDLCDIDVVAYSCGPGSFTGVRIGAAVGQAMALANQIPLLAIPSMQIFAQGIYRAFQHQKVMVLLDARVEQVYCGYYTLGPDLLMLPLCSDQLCSQMHIDFSPINQDWVIVTDLGNKDIELIPPEYLLITDYYPNAIDMLPMALQSLKDKKMATIEQALPVYLRSEASWKKV